MTCRMRRKHLSAHLGAEIGEEVLLEDGYRGADFSFLRRMDVPELAAAY